MPRRTRLALVAAAACLAGGLVAPAEATTPAPEMRSRVSFPVRTTTDDAGNTMLADANGRALQLRGANLGKFDDITEKDVADLGAAGLTLLRLPIQWRRLEPTRGSYDTAYVQHIRDVLDWADDAGILVIVDWHQDVFGPAFGFDGIPDWATRTDGIAYEEQPGNWFYNYFQPAVQAAFSHLWNDADLQDAQVAAWTHLAAQLKGSPALLGYDLFNEPMAGTITPEDTEDLTVLAGKALKFESTELAAMYRRVIAGIRTVDRRSWLWVEPTVLVGEGLPSRLPGFNDPRAGADRIGYAPHAYSTAVEEGGDWDPSSGFVSTFESSITAYPRSHHMPVVVGEWGPIAAGKDFPGNVELVKQQIASFRHFATGWAVWYGCRSATGGGYCILSDDAGHLDKGRAAAWAPYALALAGTRVSERSTRKTFTLTYRPRHGHGRSRFIVPSGFADRISVAVTDREHPRFRAHVNVSRPSRTGARTVTVGGPVRKHPVWKVTISAR